MDMFFGNPTYTSHAAGYSEGASASKIGRMETCVKDLELRVDRMSLACQALWELLEQHTDMNEHMLQDKMSEIDLRDGSRDNKIAMSVLVCPNCGRRSNSRRQLCIFCGRSVPSKHVFG